MACNDLFTAIGVSAFTVATTRIGENLAVKTPTLLSPHQITHLVNTCADRLTLDSEALNGSLSELIHRAKYVPQIDNPNKSISRQLFIDGVLKKTEYRGVVGYISPALRAEIDQKYPLPIDN